MASPRKARGIFRHPFLQIFIRVAETVFTSRGLYWLMLRPLVPHAGCDQRVVFGCVFVSIGLSTFHFVTSSLGALRRREQGDDAPDIGCRSLLGRSRMKRAYNNIVAALDGIALRGMERVLVRRYAVFECSSTGLLSNNRPAAAVSPRQCRWAYCLSSPPVR